MHPSDLSLCPPEQGELSKDKTLAHLEDLESGIATLRVVIGHI